jgi:hypothetical protein
MVTQYRDNSIKNTCLQQQVCKIIFLLLFAALHSHQQLQHTLNMSLVLLISFHALILSLIGLISVF